MEDVIKKRGPGRPRVIDATPPAMDDDWREPIDTMRGDVRADLRESDPQEAARVRAAQIRDQNIDAMEETDEFFIPDELKSPHWDMQWIRYSCFNQEDVNNINRYKRHGWTEVPAKRPGFDRYVPKGWKESFILKDGQLLVERPAEISVQVQKRAKSEAEQRVRIAEMRPSNPNIAFPMENNGQPISARGVAGVRKSISGPIPN